MSQRCAFLIMICAGNFLFNKDCIKPLDVYSYWWDCSTQSTLQASVSFDIPPVEKQVKKQKRKLKRLSKRKQKGTNSIKLTKQQKNIYLAAGIANLVLAIFCAAGACAGICVGLLSAISSALFLGFWSLASMIVCIILMIVGFVKMRSSNPQRTLLHT